jgi:hypothetical protein
MCGNVVGHELNIDRTINVGSAAVPLQVANAG